MEETVKIMRKRIEELSSENEILEIQIEELRKECIGKRHGWSKSYLIESINMLERVSNIMKGFLNEIEYE